MKGGYRGPVAMTADEQIHFFAEDNSKNIHNDDNNIVCYIIVTIR